MPRWHEEREEGDQWPVRYPARAPAAGGERRFEKAARRWPGAAGAEGGEVRKRLLWLLLAVEVGMILAAACLLPLLFVGLPVGEKGALDAVLAGVGRWLDLPARATCLVLALPLPILLLTVGLNLWLYRRARRKQEGTSEEPRG
ncbi:MAG: hypothetical protein PVF47_10045 [Anaerolineae bacterium]|jgi:hypothetical protein